VTSDIFVDEDDFPREVSWTLACEGVEDAIMGGAGQQTPLQSLPAGTLCTLVLHDSYGDGWEGAEWRAPGWTDQSFSLKSENEFEQVESFYVLTAACIPPKTFCHEDSNPGVP